MNEFQSQTIPPTCDHDEAAAPCRYCGDRPGRDVYRGVCWICELGVLVGDLPKPDETQMLSLNAIPPEIFL